MPINAFSKSDTGAQAAWKGFSSQTLYIASRLLSDKRGYEYYPEDIEDLVVKKNGVVIEAVQVKNITADLTLSSLAATKTSKGGEGFFNRMCSLHVQTPSFHCIKVVHFNALGAELQELQKGNKKVKESVVRRLKNNHGLSETEAEWLIEALYFEKVSFDYLDTSIRAQICDCVPVMPAPELAEELLIQYISVLSKNKGYTTLEKWREKIHEIGTNISAIDGFYKEYNKSLVRLNELQLNSSHEQLKYEYEQGVSAHPAHIRKELDFKRNYWMEKIQTAINNKGIAILKGVSGQGKSTLCYRYLIDTYPEGCVFCVRSIANEGQALNLVTALDGLGKHNKNLIIYIDVQPGEILWAFLLQELQSRGLSIPVLISIRDEDYNQTPISGKTIQYEIVELTLSKEEAEQIYNSFTGTQPHAEHRTFEEAWQLFGGQGPLIEFVYLLTNNQSLTQRLQEQIDKLLQENIPDEWLELLQLVCYAGRLGCTVNIEKVKDQIHCSTMYAAIRRLKDEYLIREVDNNNLEALHPVRAEIVFGVLRDQICIKNMRDVAFKTLSCISSQNVRVVLLDYFSNQPYSIEDVQCLSAIKFSDWIGYANAIKSMLWLDAKRYVDCNMMFISSLVKKRGKGWLCFLPIDLSGLHRSGELIADGMKNIPVLNKEDFINTIDGVKKSLTSLSIDYQATDYFVNNCEIPSVLPHTDSERTSFGYALFWMAKRGLNLALPFMTDEIVRSVCGGELQPSADAVRGLFEHPLLSESYQNAVDIIVEKLIVEMQVVTFSVTSSEVICKFIPPFYTEIESNDNMTNTNQYWRIKMLDILKQLYPEKEYIDIELIGVDLWRDIGIKAYDYKLHIHKSKRPNTWVSELNGWVKIRIDYSLRPATWQQYVAEIDEIRTNVNDLVVLTIKLIDDVYKKGRYTTERGKQIDNLIKVFRKHTFAENKLPYFVVDPYCLYSEGNAKSPVAEFFPMRQLLSVGKYEKFRKYLNDVYSSLDNFYNQFIEVIRVRINKQDISAVKNPRLAMFNLYSAAKTLINFQKEYRILFSNYSSLNENFIKQELENVLTLVNVWRYVLDNQPKGYAIAYDAKQKYRKGSTYFDVMLSKAVTAVNGTLFKGERHAYIIVDYKIDDSNTLENEYTRIVMKLREVFKDSILLSSNRWYLETQPLEFVYVPCFSGAYSPVVYSIPFYKLLDMDESQIANPMFPCEIEPAFIKRINENKILKIWIGSIRKLGEMKMYIQRYQQVMQMEVDKKCLPGLKAFNESLYMQIVLLWKDFLLSKDIVYRLIEGADEKNRELIKVVQLFCDYQEDIMSIIRNQNDPSELLQIIEIVVGAMIVLQPVVSEYGSDYEYV